MNHNQRVRKWLFELLAKTGSEKVIYAQKIENGQKVKIEIEFKKEGD